MAKYGQLTPPAYDLKKIPRNMPLFLSYGAQDTLADPKDVQTLLRDLQGHDKDKLKVQLVKKYAHADFIMAYNAKDIVYTQVLDFFKKFGWPSEFLLIRILLGHLSFQISSKRISLHQ